MPASDTNPTLHSFFFNSLDATLVCFRGADGQYLVESINSSARQLLGLAVLPDCPRPLQDLLPETGLLTALETVYQTQATTKTQLTLPVAGQADKLFDAEVITLESQFIVRLAEPVLPLKLAVGQHIVDSSLTSVLVFEAVRTVAGTIDDFRLVYRNDTARNQTHLGAGERPGRLLTEMNPDTRTSGLFNQYVQVVETGQVFQAEHEFSNLNQVFQVAASRFGDGIIISRYNSTEKQRVIRQNQQQAALLQAILQSSQDFIIVCQALRDTAGRIYDFKPLVYSQALIDRGILSEQVLRDHTFNQIRLDDTTAIQDYIRVVETGAPFRQERLFGLETERRWFDVTATKLDDGFLTISRDIHAEKAAQGELMRQMNLVEQILNNTANPIYLADAIRDERGNIIDFRIIRGNDAARNFMIRTIGRDGIGSTLLTLYPFSRERGLFPTYVSVVETGTSFETEYCYDYENVREWQHVAVRKAGDGVVVTCMDITESRQIRQQIEQSATELRTVIDSAQVAIFLITPVWSDEPDEAGRVIIDFRFRIANRKFASYVGQEPDALTGMLASRWFPGYRATGLFDRYVTLFNTGQGQQFDYHYNAEGNDVWLSVTANKLENDVMITFSDYTQLKQLQQRLEASVIELQHSNTNLEQFAYVASHDLQEPLRKIQAFGDLLQTQYTPVLGAEGADLIGRMQSAAARMQVLIKDVLAYSRIATKRDSLRPVALNDLVKEVLSDLETAIADKKAVVRVGLLPTVVGDAPQLRQLFQNLMSNALKFTRPGVVPEVQLDERLVSGQEAGLPVSPADASRLFHLLTFTDNGIGFEPRHAERIFQVFQRLHGRSEYVGTGIGLAIVQKVVQNHQGYIVADGRPGQGTTFRMLLPAGVG